MSASGALFDFVKLTDISKNVISKMSAEEVFELSNAWAKEYDEKLATLYAKDEQYAKDILNIDRENKKPRKDLANGPIFRIISVICMMKRLPLAMSFAAMQQMNLQRAFLKIH